MIIEDYISFKTAKLLKEKGFDVPVELFYNNDGRWCRGASPYNWNDDKDINDGMADYSMPSIYIAMKWLREGHNIYIIIEPHLFKEKKAIEYCFNYWVDGHYHMPYNESYPVYHPLYAKTWESYEEAAEVAIQYCLENLI